MSSSIYVIRLFPYYSLTSRITYSRVERKHSDLKKPDSSVGDDGVLGKENRSSSNSNSKLKNSLERVANEVQNSVKRIQIKPITAEKYTPSKSQVSSKILLLLCNVEKLYDTFYIVLQL
ncbi:hypothetical protein L6452_15297 [Arctium lappa]|uniref:Uncharacterized protein n=1 Tax=Arctium lappa TaxID=4217 RepID=A0ACB9CND2_ARCLA|nr:hypothetical protein L6452_15297 [Arctium lappa]